MNRKIERFIKNHPGVDTRVVTKEFSGPFTTRQKIAGHLSWLVRTNKIHIITTVPNKVSKAY